MVDRGRRCSPTRKKSTYLADMTAPGLINSKIGPTAGQRRLVIVDAQQEWPADTLLRRVILTSEGLMRE